MRRATMGRRHSRRTRGQPRRAAVVGGCCLVLGLLAGGAGASDPVFVEASGSPVEVGAEPHSVAAADLTGDGMADLAVANYGSDDVSILRGDGAGHFSDAISVAVGDGPLGLAVGDLNRDGRPDLAVANGVSDDLSILLGDGAGGFDPAGPPIALTNGPWYVAIGDLNRDRKLDVVVSHVGFSGTSIPSRDVSILLGNGRGGFAHASGSPITVGKVPYGTEIVDLNHDRKPDLAIANQFEDTISILLGDGTGRFIPAAGSPPDVGQGPSWLDAADFNGDGDADLAVAGGSGNMSILFGNGAGSFDHAPGSPIAVRRNTTIVRAADFSGDGKLDLGMTNFQANDFSVLLGDGQGSFRPAPGPPHPVGELPLSMAVADLNGDRKPDVAVGNHRATTVTVLLNATPSPADAIAALKDDVRASALAPGLRGRLVAKLLFAEHAVRQGLERVACRALDAFVADLRANSGSGGLTPADALAWTADANAIRGSLGCGS